MSGLTYIGNGAAIIGIPARDLTEQEVEELNWLMTEDHLLASGLYKRPGDFDIHDAEKVMPHVLKRNKKESE